MSPPQSCTGKTEACSKELDFIDGEILNLEAALKIHPDFSDNLFRLGELYQGRGHFDKAVIVIKELFWQILIFSLPRNGYYV